MFQFKPCVTDDKDISKHQNPYTQKVVLSSQLHESRDVEAVLWIMSLCYEYRCETCINCDRCNISDVDINETQPSSSIVKILRFPMSHSQMNLRRFFYFNICNICNYSSDSAVSCLALLTKTPNSPPLASQTGDDVTSRISDTDS
jgi:hypothetical protein